MVVHSCPGIWTGFHPLRELLLLSSRYGPAHHLWPQIMDSTQRRLNFTEDLKRKWAPSINSSVLSWLQRDQDKPFFVFINYLDVHDPYVPPQPYLSRFKGVENPAQVSDYPIDDPHLTPEGLLKDIYSYDGAIAYLDDHIGQLLAEVRRLGLDDNLLIVFTSDHGEAF